MNRSKGPNVLSAMRLALPFIAMGILSACGSTALSTRPGSGPRVHDDCADRGAPGVWEPMAPLPEPGLGAERTGSEGQTRPPPTLWARGRMRVFSEGPSGYSYDPCADAWTAFARAAGDEPTREDAEEPLVARRGDFELDLPGVVPEPRLFLQRFVGGRIRLRGGPWMDLPVAGAPSDRSLPESTALAANRLALWSGWQGPGTWAPDGAILHLDGPRWETIAPRPGGPERARPDAVIWTGERLVVLQTEFSAPLSGHVYDRATRRWAVLPVDDAPRLVGTERHFLWTGRVVLYLPRRQTPEPHPLVGGVYDPQANRWIRAVPTPEDLAELPGGPLRFWRIDDDRLLVRFDRGSALAVLDVRDGSWTRLPPPPMDSEQPAVHFTGSRVIVYGGVHRTVVHPGAQCGPRPAPRSGEAVETSCDDVDPTYRARLEPRGFSLRLP